MGLRERRIGAIAVLAGWAGIGGCTLFEPLSGLTSGEDAGSTGADGAGASDVGAMDSTPRGDSAPQGDAAAEDAPSQQDAPGTPHYERTLKVVAADALSPGYAVSFQLDTASLVAQGKVRSDLNDLRVFDPTGKELDRIVDPTSPSVTWFALTRAIAAGASDDYAVHYGDPSAGPAPAKGSAVFSFYDDFQGSSLGAQWVTLGSPTVSGGAVHLHAWDPDASPDPDSMRTDPQTDGVQAASWLEIDAKVTDPSSAADAVNGFWYWLGFQRQGDFEATYPWILWISRHTKQVSAEDVDVDASFTGSAAPQDNQPHAYVVARAPSSTTFYRDGVMAYTAPYPNSSDYALMLRNWMPSSDVVVTRVRDRPLVDNEPTVDVGAEQSLP